MTFYVGSRHSFCIHGDNLLFHVLSDSVLIFFDYLRFKLALSVTWNIQFHIAIAGMHSLLRITITTVVGILVTVIILGISQLLIQFFIKSPRMTDIMSLMIEFTSVPSLTLTLFSFI